MSMGKNDEIGEDLIKRMKEHVEASQQLRHRNNDHTQKPTDERPQVQYNPREAISCGKKVRRDPPLVRKKAYMKVGEETAIAYDIPGGWYMAFDATAGAPFFWRSDVNEGATTWTPPMDTKTRYEQ